MSVMTSKTMIRFPWSKAALLRSFVICVIVEAGFFLPLLVSFVDVQDSFTFAYLTAPLTTIGLLVALPLLCAIVQLVLLESVFYDINDHYVMIKRGSITPQDMTISYRNIEEVEVYADFIDKSFGLSSIKLTSSRISEEAKDLAVIRFLSNKNSQELKNDIIELCHKLGS